MKKEIGGANLCLLSYVKKEWAAFKTDHSFSFESAGFSPCFSTQLCQFV